MTICGKVVSFKFKCLQYSNWIRQLGKWCKLIQKSTGKIFCLFFGNWNSTYKDSKSYIQNRWMEIYRIKILLHFPYLFDYWLWHCLRINFSIQIKQSIQVTRSSIKQLIWKIRLWSKDYSLELQKSVQTRIEKSNKTLVFTLNLRCNYGMCSCKSSHDYRSKQKLASTENSLAFQMCFELYLVGNG